jgi:ATP-dependent Clp protease protease subunit
MQIFKYLLFLTTLLFSTSQTIILEKNKYVPLIGSIDEDITNEFIRKASEIANITKDLMIYINSPGGSVTEGEKIINQIEFYKKNEYKVNCIALNAFSMAFYVFQSCDTRYITNISKLMSHKMILSMFGVQLQNLLNYLDMVKKIDDRLTNMVCNKINMPVSEYNAKQYNDWWIYGDDIITYRLADTIVYVNLDVTVDNNL